VCWDARTDIRVGLDDDIEVSGVFLARLLAGFDTSGISSNSEPLDSCRTRGGGLQPNVAQFVIETQAPRCSLLSLSSPRPPILAEEESWSNP